MNKTTFYVDKRRIRMDNRQTDSIALSRDEYIQMARESCVKNLHSDGGTNKNELHRKTPNNYSIYKNSELFSGMNIKSSGMRSLLIRTICVLVLFLSILMVDKLKISIRTFNSDFIKNAIVSNEGVEKAEDFFVSVFKKLDSNSSNKKE